MITRTNTGMRSSLLLLALRVLQCLSQPTLVPVPTTSPTTSAFPTISAIPSVSSEPTVTGFPTLQPADAPVISPITVSVDSPTSSPVMATMAPVVPATQPPVNAFQMVSEDVGPFVLSFSNVKPLLPTEVFRWETITSSWFNSYFVGRPDIRNMNAGFLQEGQRETQTGNDIVYSVFMQYEASPLALTSSQYAFLPFSDQVFRNALGQQLREIPSMTNISIPFPLPQEATPTEPPIAPPTSTPVTLAPVTNAPVTAAPITSAPVTGAPVTGAPILNVSMVPSLAPSISQAPTGLPTLSSVPTLSPTVSVMPSEDPNATTATAAPNTTAPIAMPTAAPVMTTMAPNVTTNQTTTAPTGSPVVATDSPTAMPAAPTQAPTESLFETPTTSVEYRDDLELTFRQVGRLSSEELVLWEEATRDWFSSYYLNDARRRRLQRYPNVLDMVTVVKADDQVVTTENGESINKILYSQSLDYNAGPGARPAAQLLVEPFEDDITKAEYAQMLRSRIPAMNTVTQISSPIISDGGDGDDDGGFPIWGFILAGLGGAAVCCVVGGLCYRYFNSDEDFGYGKAESHPPASFNVSADEDISTIDDPLMRQMPSAEPSLLEGGGYGDQSVATVDYDYSKAYGGGGASVVSSAGGTMGDTTRQTGEAAAAATLSALGAESQFRSNEGGTREDTIVIDAPAGKLGVVIDTPDDGAPVVHAVKDSSVIADQIQVGDKLIAVDNDDVRSMTAIKVSKLISKKSSNPSRRLTIIRTSLAD